MIKDEELRGAVFGLTKSRYFKNLTLYLIKEAVIYCIKQKIIDEFVNQGLHKVYAEEIEEWFVYLDQQRFGRKLKAQILKEVYRYMEGKETIEELIDRVFEKPKWEIEFVKTISKNYFFKGALGYA